MDATGGAGIGGGYGGHGGTITINGGMVTASSTGGTGGPAAIGGGGDSTAGVIRITGGCVVALNGALNGQGSGIDKSGGYTSASGGGTITIEGGTIIVKAPTGIGSAGVTPTISGNPFIFARAVQGQNESSESGIIIGSSVVNTGNLNTINLNKNIVAPTGTTLTIPSGWTLNYNGHTITGATINSVIN